MIPVSINKLFFIDIETTGGEATFDKMSKPKQELFESYKDWFIKRFPEEAVSSTEEIFVNKSALVPEFSKIVVISCGWVKDGNLVMKSFSGESMLKGFRDLADRFYTNGYHLCGHNVKSFDIPTIAKHYCMNGLSPIKFAPRLGEKPWDLRIVDTKELWQFGNNFSLSSLDLVCKVLEIDTPKGGEVEGKNLHNFFYSEKKDKMKRITEYCESDIKALFNIITKIVNLN